MINFMLIPHTRAPASPPASELLPGHHDELLVRRHGMPRLGCVLFFPERHGDLSA